MLVAAAVCPCPPLLVPEIAAGAAHETDAARAACDEAVAALAAARPDRLVVAGPADEAEAGPYPQGARGSFRGYGVDLEVSLGAGDPPAGVRPLPPSLAVGAWLLGRNGWTAAPVEGHGVDERLGGVQCEEAGRRLAEGDARVAVLVMGDGANCRSLKAPGYFDERAAGFDARVARALAEADAGALLALEEETALELHASGRSSWQLLAGAAGRGAPGEGNGSGLRGKLLYDDAPYGVGYFVAVWT